MHYNYYFNNLMSIDIYCERNTTFWIIRNNTIAMLPKNNGVDHRGIKGLSNLSLKKWTY
jgi:hypothetical protein